MKRNKFENPSDIEKQYSLDEVDEENSHQLVIENSMIKKHINQYILRKVQFRKEVHSIENSFVWRLSSKVRKYLSYYKDIIKRDGNLDEDIERSFTCVEINNWYKYPLVIKNVFHSPLYELRVLKDEGRNEVTFLIGFNLEAIKKYLNDLESVEAFERRDELAPTLNYVNEEIPVLMFKVNRTNFTLETLVQYLNIEFNNQETPIRILLPKTLREVIKGVHREEQASYKLFHLLTAAMLVNGNTSLSGANIIMAIKYTGYCLETRMRSSFFFEGLEIILEGVKENRTFKREDMEDLIGALLYVSGYRTLAIQFIGKREDLRAIAYGLSVNSKTLFRFHKTEKGKLAMDSLLSRKCGKAEQLFFYLKANVKDISQFLNECNQLEGFSEQANDISKEIIRKVLQYNKTGIYPKGRYASDNNIYLQESDILSKQVQKIFVSGFGWSGSSALSDFLKDCGVKVMPGPGHHKLINYGAEDEPTIFENIGSLEELWDTFVLQEGSKNVLLDFIRLHVLAVLPKRPLEMKACLWTRAIAEKYEGNYYILIDQFLYNLLGKHSKSKEEKKLSFTIFVNGLINMIAKREKTNILLFDNAIKAQNVRLLEMFGESTFIVVARDPDDQYISMQKENMYVKRSPETFVSMQYDKLSEFSKAAKILKEKGKVKILAIFFEELVQNDQKWRQHLIRELLGQDYNIPNVENKKLLFNPSLSVKNINQFVDIGRVSTENGLTKGVYNEVLKPYKWNGN